MRLELQTDILRHADCFSGILITRDQNVEETLDLNFREPFGERLTAQGQVILIDIDETDDPESAAQEFGCESSPGLRVVFLSAIEDLLGTNRPITEFEISPLLERRAQREEFDPADVVEVGYADYLLREALSPIRPGISGPRLARSLNAVERLPAMMRRLGAIGTAQSGWDLVRDMYFVEIDEVLSAAGPIDLQVPGRHQFEIVTHDASGVNRDDLGEWHAWDIFKIAKDEIEDEVEGKSADPAAEIESRLRQFQLELENARSRVRAAAEGRG